ncbi:MAG: hypothetical protein JSR55_14830 [Proteobacteria bacterium]|nr:hypothetical protein [Pseudomonadota bacterium]
MAETRSRFMESAERLEGVVRALKLQQIGERQGPVQLAPVNMTAASPDELWAKQFATQCIGPVCFKAAPGSEIALPSLTQSLQSLPPHQSAYAPRREMAHAAIPAANARATHIGAALGKPKRRGLVARLFGH